MAQLNFPPHFRVNKEINSLPTDKQKRKKKEEEEEQVASDDDEVKERKKTSTFGILLSVATMTKRQTIFHHI